MIKAISYIAKVHPKSVSRLFKRAQIKDKSSERKRGRKIYEGKDVDYALYDGCESANRPCEELLHPMISEYVNTNKRETRWQHSFKATTQFLEMSEGTIKIKVRAFKQKYDVFHGKSTTKPSSLKSIIPVFK